MRVVTHIKRKGTSDTIRVCQIGKALADYTSEMGSPIKKGDKVLHLSSGVKNGQTYILTMDDLMKLWGSTKLREVKRITPKELKKYGWGVRR